MRRRTGFGKAELITGILLIIVGIIALFRPKGLLTGVVLVCGLLALVTGVMDILYYVKMEQHMGFGPTVSLITGILSVMAGLILLVYPGAGRWALMVFLPLWILAHCISRLSHLGIVRYTGGVGYYYFSLLLNVLGLVLGFLMLIKPSFLLKSYGIIVGVYLILTGVDSIGVATSDMGSDW